MNMLYKVLFIACLLMSVACQRNNMPYGGVKEDATKIPYTTETNLNSQNK